MTTSLSGELICGLTGELATSLSGELICGLTSELTTSLSGELTGSLSGELICDVSGELICSLSDWLICGLSNLVRAADNITTICEFLYRHRNGIRILAICINELNTNRLSHRRLSD